MAFTSRFDCALMSSTVADHMPISTFVVSTLKDGFSALFHAINLVFTDILTHASIHLLQMLYISTYSYPLSKVFAHTFIVFKYTLQSS